MIKVTLIGDHEIKIENFADDTTIVLRDILKLYENEKINKLNDNLGQRYFFQKVMYLWTDA